MLLGDRSRKGAGFAHGAKSRSRERFRGQEITLKKNKADALGERKTLGVRGALQISEGIHAGHQSSVSDGRFHLNFRETVEIELVGGIHLDPK